MQNRLRRIILSGAVCMLSMGILAGCGDKGKEDQTVTQEQKQEEVSSEEGNQEAKADDEKPDQLKSAELETVAQPQFIANSLRKLTLVQDGEEIFQISREPADYKMSFDYWEILNPYDEIATVNTETMYTFFNIVGSMDFTAPVEPGDGVDTGIRNTETSITVEFVNTLDDDTAKNTEDADSTAAILIGNEDGEGYRYVSVKGYEDTVYKLPESLIDNIYAVNPFDYILKIPALVNLDTVKSVDITAGKNTYSMEIDGEKYKLGKKEVDKDTFTTLYQALMNVTLSSEIQEVKEDGEKEEVLSVTFHRNTEEAPEVELVYYTYDDTCDSVAINGKERFLVKAEEVRALLAQIQETY